MVSSFGFKSRQLESGSSSQPSGWISHQKYLCGLVLVVSILALYYPVRNYPFFSVDDYLYVTGDPHVLGPFSWSTIKWAFTHAFVLNYDPLTLLAHNLNVQLFQVDPGRHHEVNVVLHALNALLLFWVLRRATGFTARSFMVAALFAVHPINVENVAWISELKTILSTAFFFLALGAYHWYGGKPAARRMVVVELLYVLGLLAKPQVITLPFVLLLWDYWPLQRMFAPPGNAPQPIGRREAIPASNFSALVKEKFLLFAIAIADAVVTMVAEHKGSLESWPYTFSIRLGNGILSYARYVSKAFWPVRLAYMYPHPGFSLHWLSVWFALVFLLAVSVFVLAERRHRYLLVGWFWFLGTLVPMIGLVQIDLPALADRYAYVSFIGLFLMVCWGVADLAKYGHLPRVVLPLTSAAILAILSVLTYRQVGYWSDSVTLWKHTMRVTPHSWAAELGIGIAYQRQGQPEEALPHFYRAAEDNPMDPQINLGIAVVEHQRGNLRLAIQYYEKVLAVSKDTRLTNQAWANMGHAYSDLGDSARARRCYEALRSQPLPSYTGVD